MALERVPADIRKDGGVARMSDPGMIKEIKVGPVLHRWTADCSGLDSNAAPDLSNEKNTEHNEHNV
jgi:hypothetical protein